jgi:hypothetical protein
METKNINDCDRSNFTLTRSIPYQIKIAGRLSENWSDWLEQMDILIETDSDGLATTTITGCIDQAALLGLLRQFYQRGYPLISVNCIQSRRNDDN